MSPAAASPPLPSLDRSTDALVDGRPLGVGAIARLRRRGQRLLVTDAEREEAQLEHRLRTLPGVGRANTVVVVSPKGGVGKTTSAFAIATLLTTHLKLRVVAVDSTPRFGTLARLAPGESRSSRAFSDLLCDADRLRTAAEVSRYMSRLPSGLHLLAAPSDREPASLLAASDCGELVALLSCFYEAVVLDVRTGVVDPLARFAVERADQVVLVTTPDWVTATLALGALEELPRRDRTCVVINQATRGSPAVRAVEDRFRAERLQRTVTIPYDGRLAAMLESGTYALDALRAPTRLAIKRLGLAVAQQLV